MSESITETIDKYYDNGLENIGSWNSYTWWVELRALAKNLMADSQDWSVMGSSVYCTIPAIQMLAFGGGHPRPVRYQTTKRHFRAKFRQGRFQPIFHYLHGPRSNIPRTGRHFVRSD